MTQGIVSLMKVGRVVMKIVAGSNGKNAKDLARWLRSIAHVPTMEEAYALAVQCSFGARDNLVILTEGGTLFKGDEDLNERYRRTFSDPRFNPRWEYGTADFIELVHLPS